jgi:hypothetical protein
MALLTEVAHQNHNSMVYPEALNAPSPDDKILYLMGFCRLLTSRWMSPEVIGSGEMVGRVATTFTSYAIDL